jgi:hypothetical protein
MASLRNLAIGILCLHGHRNIAAAQRHNPMDPTFPHFADDPRGTTSGAGHGVAVAGPVPVRGAGQEATRKICGVLMAMLPGWSRAPPWPTG